MALGYTSSVLNYNSCKKKFEKDHYTGFPEAEFDSKSLRTCTTL